MTIYLPCNTCSQCHCLPCLFTYIYFVHSLPLHSVTVYLVCSHIYILYTPYLFTVSLTTSFVHIYIYFVHSLPVHSVTVYNLCTHIYFVHTIAIKMYVSDSFSKLTILCYLLSINPSILYISFPCFFEGYSGLIATLQDSIC